jgi:1-acyl-sn-glycerol-3-phosphate acyltransferase
MTLQTYSDLGPTPSINELRDLMGHEIMSAVGLPRYHFLRGMITYLLKPPLSYFAKICAEVDQSLQKFGMCEGVKRVLPYFFSEISFSSNEMVPKEGPLLLVSNHPGGMDAITIAAYSGREDVKVISGDIPFLQRLPRVNTHLIVAPRDPTLRMRTIRRAIIHLQRGGTLIIFPSAKIDPDPHYFGNAKDHLMRWSLSLEIFLRKVPDLQVQPVIASNLLSPYFIHHPLTYLRKYRIDRQRIAQFLQVFSMMFIKANRFRLNLSYGKLLDLSGFDRQTEYHQIRCFIIESALKLFDEHMTQYPPVRQYVWEEQPIEIQDNPVQRLAIEANKEYFKK